MSRIEVTIGGRTERVPVPSEPDSPGRISWILFALSVAFLAWFLLRAVFPPGTGGG